MQHRVVGSHSAAIGAAVRLLMAQQQLSTPELARQLSIDRTALWRSLSGRRPFPLDELAAIANFLGRRASEVLVMAESIEEAGFSPCQPPTESAS